MLHITCAHGVVACWRGPVRVGSGGGQGLVARRSARTSWHAHAERRHGRAAATRATPAWVPPEPPAPGEMPLAKRSECSLRATVAKGTHGGTPADGALRCARSWSMEGSRPWPRNVAGGIRVLCLRP